MQRNHAIGFLLLAFSALALIGPFYRTATFWCAYFCGALPIILQLCDFRRSGAAEGGMGRVAGLRASLLGAQLLLSFAEMALAGRVPVWLALTSNLMLAILALTGCTLVRVTDSVPDVSQLQAMTTSMRALCGDLALRDMLGRIASELSGVSPLAGRRVRLFRQLNDVRHAIYYGDADNAKLLCEELLCDMGEPAAQCRCDK